MGTKRPEPTDVERQPDIETAEAPPVEVAVSRRRSRGYHPSGGPELPPQRRR
jgi:hypothetical protein